MLTPIGKSSDTLCQQGTHHIARLLLQPARLFLTIARLLLQPARLFLTVSSDNTDVLHQQNMSFLLHLPSITDRYKVSCLRDLGGGFMDSAYMSLYPKDHARG
jgi:hypothetical protein